MDSTTPRTGAVTAGSSSGRTAVAQVVEAAAALLRARGDRMTAPRRAVLTVLAERRAHLSPDQVVAAVAAHDPAVHRASVYRALETLSQVGVVQHVHLGHGTTAYHLAVEHRHLHAHCRECGRLVDLPGDLLDAAGERLSRELGFVLDAEHVALSGTCAECARAT